MTLAVGVLVASYYWIMEIGRPFSGAKEMAAYLDETGHSRSRIAMHLPASGSAILAYMREPRTFWYPALDAEGSYMMWDLRYEPADDIGYVELVDLVARLDRSALLLLNEAVDDPPSHGVSLLFHTGADVFEKPDETFYLYAFVDPVDQTPESSDTANGTQ